jgi:hypothetical protein
MQKSLFSILLPVLLLVWGFPQAWAAGETLNQPAFKLEQQINLEGRTLKVFQEGPNYLVTHADGRFVRDAKLGEAAVLSALVKRKWCQPAELAEFERFNGTINRFLKVEAAAQVALFLRGGAAQALVDVSVAYLTGDASQMGKEFALKQLKSASKKALKDAVLNLAKNPGAYLRAMAAKMLKDCGEELKKTAGLCGSLKSRVIKPAELSNLDARARRAYAKLVPAMGLMQALRPKADLASQLKDVLGDMTQRLKEKLPGFSAALDSGQPDIYEKLGGAIDQIYQSYRPYMDYRRALASYAAKAKQGRIQLVNEAEEKFRLGLAFAEGHEYLAQGAGQDGNPDAIGQALAGAVAGGAGAILDGQGYGPIKVGVSTRRQVEKQFGDGFKTSRSRHIYRMIYEKLGMEFWYRPQDSKGLITNVKFFAPFKGATRRGISIGQHSMAQVIKAYGPPHFYTFSNEMNWYNEYPGIVFVIKADPKLKKYPLNREVHDQKRIQSIRVSRVDRWDIYLRKGYLKGWSKSGGSHAGTRRFGQNHKVSGNYGSAGYKVTAGGRKVYFSVRIMQFDNPDLAQRYGVEYLNELRQRKRKKKNYLGGISLLSQPGGHAEGYRLKCGKKSYRCCMETILDRYVIEVNTHCMDNAHSPDWVLQRYQELLRFLDSRIRFNEEQ